MMANLSANRRSTSYLVPCVFKAIQMVELMRKTRAGLRVEDLLAITGYSRSTIYRILRTLTACEYTFRDAGGYYRLNHAVVATADESAAPTEVPNAPDRSAHSNDSAIEFERWGVRFRGDGRRLNGASLAVKTERAMMSLP